MKLEKLKVCMQSLKEVKNESAFTLIELIVGISILAILGLGIGTVYLLFFS